MDRAHVTRENERTNVRTNEQTGARRRAQRYFWSPSRRDTSRRGSRFSRCLYVSFLSPPPSLTWISLLRI